MAFPQDLLDLAEQLARLDRNRPRQASLRRAVSTAYYALFHLLISEATNNWRIVSQRDALGRAFEHGKMKHACHTCTSSDADIRGVAETFVQLQQARHLADYDNGRIWTRTQVLTLTQATQNAFRRWAAARRRPDAQEFLLHLLTGRR